MDHDFIKISPYHMWEGTGVWNSYVNRNVRWELFTQDKTENTSKNQSKCKLKDPSPGTYHVS